MAGMVGLKVREIDPDGVTATFVLTPGPTKSRGFPEPPVDAADQAPEIRQSRLVVLTVQYGGAQRPGCGARVHTRVEEGG